MRESGNAIRPMDMAHIRTKMGQCLQDTGRMMTKRGTAWRNEMMAHIMMDITSIAKSTALGNIHGLMDQYTLGNG